jgi:hypothetical protein
MSNINALIERWQAGDDRAAEAIYNQYRGATFGLAYTLLDDAADEEEAVTLARLQQIKTISSE